MVSVSRLSKESGRSSPVAAGLGPGRAAAARRISQAEEQRLATRLGACRQELLAIALLDPASSTELQQLFVEVLEHARSIESVVVDADESPEAARQELAAFVRRARQLPEEATRVWRTLEREEQPGSEALREAAPLPARLQAVIDESQRVVASLPLNPDISARLIEHSRVGRGPGARAVSSRADVPQYAPYLEPRVRLLEAEIDGIRKSFITANQGLVSYVVQRYLGLGLGRDDLMQDGNIGLLRAIEKFDPRRRSSFASYAVWWIREAVRRALAKQSRTIRIPVHALAARYTLGRVSRRLAHELGREPSRQELAEAAGVNPENIAELLALLKEPLSLDAPRSGEVDATLGEGIADRSAVSPNERTSEKESARQLHHLLADLNEREQQILRLRFGLDGGEERTLEEIGRSFSLTRERVRQIVAAALAKLHRQTQLRELDL
jgi:RNA polymerase sigma factor (sigma-70 family)